MLSSVCQDAATRMGLKRYVFKSKHYEHEEIAITAKNRDSAWGKFVTLRFGPLKPCRRDWKIVEQRPRKTA